MATTDASYSFTLRVKPSASNSYKIGIPFCPASFFDESTINLKIVWGDGSSDTELTTVASATDNILLEHTYSDTTMKNIEVHGGYGADSNFEGGKIAFPQSSKHDANGIAQDQAVPTGSTLDKISQLMFEKVANGKPVTGFYIHGQGDFQNFTKLWSHSTLTQLRNFIWSSDPASEIKHVGDKNFGYICFDKTFENCHTGLAYTANSNHALYPTGFRVPLNGGGWQNASRRSKSFQRTFANSKVNSGISGWGPSRFAKSTREMFKDNTVFSRNINKLFATGNENSLTDMEGMFENTQAFSKHMLNWNTSKVTNMINVFKNSKYDRRLDTWDVSKVTSMKGFLEGNTDYASRDGGDYRDIKEWFDPYLNPDGSKRDANNPRTFAIESLEGIFKDSAVNVDISTWNTSTVTNMKNVFNGNTAFDQDISDWDTSNVSTENLAGFATGATGLTASEVPSSVPSDSVAADPATTTDSSTSSSPAPSAPQSGDQSSTSIDFSNGSWEQVGDNINGEYESDEFGRAVSLNSDGTIVAIGAYKNSGLGFESGSSDFTYSWAGHVRIFQNDNGTWTQMGSEINGQAQYEFLGISVSLSSDGTIVAIGGYSGSSTNGPGKIRVYEYNSTTEDWEQVGDDIDGEYNTGNAGYSVSLSSDGTIVAFGEPNINAGRFAVYENVNGTWTQLGENITYSDYPDGGTKIGRAVSLNSDGTIIAIGSPENNGNGSKSGHARIYEYNSGTEDWDQVGDDIDGEAAGDRSGASVSLSSDGTIVAVGAYGNDDNGTDSGHVRVYENVNGTWTQIGDDIDGEAAGDYSGFSVSLNSDGTIVAVGAYANDDNGTDSGHVRVYENVNGTWTQIDTDIDGDAAGDYSGVSTALSSDGTVLAVGSFYAHWTQVNTYYSQDIPNSGVVRVFEFNES